jgi:hypothetical protein
VEEREAVVLGVNLRVIAACGEIRSGERREPDRLPRHRQLARKHLADERLRRRVGRVVHDQPARAQHFFEPPTERVRHSGAGRVGAAQRRDQLIAEGGGRQNLFELVQRVDDGVVEADSGDGGRICAGPRGE